MKKRRDTEEELKAKVAKAPLWIKKLAEALFHERDAARRELAKHYEEQKPTAIYVEIYDTGGSRKQYVQSNRVTIEHAGIELEVRAKEDSDAIELRYGRPESLTAGGIGIYPSHNGCFELRAVENTSEWDVIIAKHQAANKKKPKEAKHEKR